MCRALSEQVDARDQIVNFLEEHFTCCKQHAHVLERPNEQAYRQRATLGQLRYWSFGRSSRVGAFLPVGMS